MKTMTQIYKEKITGVMQKSKKKHELNTPWEKCCKFQVI